jgi:hypothetical protein
MLNDEIAAFEARLPAMLAKHAGEFVVFRQGEARQFLPSYSTALDWAYEHYGLQPFMVREVTAVEPAVHFTRPLAPCDR